MVTESHSEGGERFCVYAPAYPHTLGAFVVKHVALRSRVLEGGFIFDSNGNVSKQLDLILMT